MRRLLKKSLAYFVAAAVSIGTFGITPVMAQTSAIPLAAAVTVPGIPNIAHDNYDGDGKFTIQATLWSNATATKATLYQKGIAIASKSLTPTQTGSQNVDFKVEVVYNDSYTYYVEYSNQAGISKSKELIVEVTKGKKYPAPPRTQPNTNGKRVVMYYPEWGIYAEHKQWMPKDIPWENITHMNYAFFTIQGQSKTIGDQVGQNEVKLFDKFAATEADAGTGEPWGSEYKGTLGAIRMAKRKYSHVRMMMSIGGWSQSANFVEAAATPEARKAFCDSAIKLMRQYEFDGVDIDWEYPGFARPADTTDNPNDQGNPRATDADTRNFTLLMKDLRAALDQAGKEDGAYYELSAAVGCGIDKMQKTEVAEYSKYMDFINLMTYDMHGAWESFTGHQSPMYGRTQEQGNPYDQVTSQYTVTQSVANFLGAGVPADKLVVGIPYYTRGWGGVKPDEIIPGLPGLHAAAQKNATGSYAPAQKGVFDGGVYAGNNPYYYIEEVLEKDPSFTKYWDPIAQVPYLYSASKEIFYTYDDPKSVGIKLDYINANNLGGAIVWEATCERVGNPVLTRQIFKAFEGNQKPLPVPPTLTIDKKKVPVGEAYTLIANVMENSAATSYQVLENGKVIDQGTVSSAAKVIKVPVVKQEAGSFTYEVVLTNNEGSRSSNKETVVVEAAVVNTPPVIQGVKDVILKVGDVFNPLVGVTATDKEDGDLTAAIKVTSNVDTSKVGSYQVTYTVADKAGLTTTQKATVVVETLVANNTAPVIEGVKDVSLKVGDTFNAQAGVTAKDKEDGDLTATIKVTSNVDTTKAGSYQVTYTVADKEGLTATKTCTVTVEAVIIVDGNYDATKVYNTGDQVTYNGKTYTAKWWTQGEKPGNAAVWEEKVVPNPDGSNPYVQGKAYVGGDIVSYNGVLYKAKWWTNTVPGSDGSWEAVK